MVGGGGLGPGLNLEAKFGARSPNKRKNLGSSGGTKSKNWDIIPGKRILYFFVGKINSEFYNKLEHQTWKTGWKNINGNDVYKKYTSHENSQRCSTQILGSYLKMKGQKLGHLSSIFLEAKFGALTQISEAYFEANHPPPPPTA